MAFVPTAAVKFVTMAVDWCMVFKVFDLLYIDFFMVGECVRFLLYSLVRLRDPSQRVSNKNRTNEPIMK